MDDLTPPPTTTSRSGCSSPVVVRSPGEFFPSDGVGVDKARKICAQCSVQEACLEYALKYRIDHGVWGGASERERRRILRRRRNGEPATTRHAEVVERGIPVTIA